MLVGGLGLFSFNVGSLIVFVGARMIGIRLPLTSLTYTLYYMVMIEIFFFLFPGFAGDWNGGFLWSFNILQIPLEEIVWGFTFTWSWILTMMYCLEIGINQQGEICETI